jgi:hypothetical protein
VMLMGPAALEYFPKVRQLFLDDASAFSEATPG